MKIKNLTEFIDFFDQSIELQTLVSLIDNDSGDYWLVGGCLRNVLLDLPQTDIDIASSVDPTPLAMCWANKTGGRWFWLDKQRKQSRVVLPDQMIFDFNPLRAESINDDLLLRDFTINSLALKLNRPLSESSLIDPLNGVEHLRQRKLKMCATQSFKDDPLRVLKGIRHAVTLEFEFENQTWDQLCSDTHLLDKVASERIRDELVKIFTSKYFGKSLELLESSGVLKIIFGSCRPSWKCQHSAEKLTMLAEKLILPEPDLPGLQPVDDLSARQMILFVDFLKECSPANWSNILHNRLRFSRHLERIVNELAKTPDLSLLNALSNAKGTRIQALLVEKLNPFAALKMLYWGVCNDLFDYVHLKELITSFNSLENYKRIPDLLNGKQVAKSLKDVSPRQIGLYQKKIKLAEINGEISSVAEAEKWLKTKLSFDNKEG